MSLEEDKLILKKDIENIMNEKKYDLIEDIAMKITKMSKKVYFNDIFEFMKSLNLGYKERILFYIKLTESSNISPTIKSELIPLLIGWLIDSNKDNFLILLDDNEFINDLSIWLKDGVFNEKILDDKILDKILKIPKIQKEVLTNPNFYTRHNSFKLFNSMPRECCANIAFYSCVRNKDFERDLKYLYSKYFANILNEKEQLELIKGHVVEINKNDLFELGLVKMLPFHYYLNCIYKDKKYFNYIKNIKENSKLDYSIILKFLYKYNKTSIFNNICKNNKPFNEDLINKIIYLSMENRLINVEQISDLEKISLDEIKSLSKEKNDIITLNVSGGPNGSEGKIFSDGFEREVRIINLDGTVTIFDARKETHETAVKLAYPNIKFDKNCTMALERAIEAAKQISSITFIIENDASYVVSNSNLSEEQIQSLNDLKIVDENKAKFGIITYDNTLNTSTLVYNGESVSFDKMIEYMKSLNSNNKAITH